MQPLGAAELLHVWEAGQLLSPPQRALAVLVAANREESPAAIARRSVGWRDGQLLALREQLFGPDVTAAVNCPRCDERVELEFRVDDVRTNGPGAEDDVRATVGNCHVTFRLVNTLDLIEIANCPSQDAARRVLLDRCVTEADCGGDSVRAVDLPDPVAAAVAQRMSEADPQADVQLATTCPSCQHTWQAAFDISTFLWREIEAWAQRTLDEVSQLAAAYHWREADILAMSAWRRQQYLARVGV